MEQSNKERGGEKWASGERAKKEIEFQQAPEGRWLSLEGGGGDPEGVEREVEREGQQVLRTHR